MKRAQRTLIICAGLIFLFSFMFISTQFSTVMTQSNLTEQSTIFKTAGPEFLDIYFSPAHPEWYDNISITAEITDPYGILEVRINYAATKDSYAGWGANFTMTHLNDSSYSYDILNSIWDSPFGPPHGARVNFTLFAKNGQGIWSQSGYYQFYMNDTVKPIAQILTLTNDSYVSGIIEINTTIIEEGSGIKAANLSIYMGNDTLLERFTTTNLNETFSWDVTSLPDYNLSKPDSYYSLNFTVWDKATPTNTDTVIVENIRIDNTIPYLAFINSYKNRTAFVLDNETITTNSISSINFTNNINATHYDNSTYHTFYNGSNGFLQVAYGFNLTTYNITASNLNTLSLTFDGKIGYSNSSIMYAGWKIWNWVHKNFTVIDATVFNSTTDVSDIVHISSINKSLFINNLANNRIEIFFFINTTGPSISGYVDYILYNMTYYETDEWYRPDNENITLHIIGDDITSFERIELHYQNYTYYTFNSSGTYLFDFNTSVLPSGLVPLNVTVFDKAGNINSSVISLNVDFQGPLLELIYPEVNLTSPENDTYIGKSGIWNLIVPVEFNTTDHNFKNMELWIDGSLAPVLPGQLGQIIEYNEYGSVIYQQTNATWYEEGIYKYYWNASTLIHNSTHELHFTGVDDFGNPSSYKFFITMATFTTNVTLIDIRENYSTQSDISIILEFKITNYGNTTLKDFTPQLIIPSGWDWNFKDVDAFAFKYLSPGASLTFKIEIVPRAVQITTNYTIQLLINCTIVENYTQSVNQFSIQIQTYLIVEPGVSDISSTIYVLISIAAGLGIGLFAFYLYQYLKKVSTQPPKSPEKVKKRK